MSTLPTVQVGLLLSISLLHRRCIILWYHGGSETRDYTNNHRFCVEKTIIHLAFCLNITKDQCHTNNQSSILQEWNESSLQALKFVYKIDIWVADVAILGWSPDLSELAKLWRAWDTRVWHSCKQQSLKIKCCHPASTGISFWSGWTSPSSFSLCFYLGLSLISFLGAWSAWSWQ